MVAMAAIPSSLRGVQWGSYLMLKLVLNPNEHPSENFTVLLNSSHPPKSLYHAGLKGKISLV